jgi:hypothetical protein
VNDEFQVVHGVHEESPRSDVIVSPSRDDKIDFDRKTETVISPMRDQIIVL